MQFDRSKSGEREKFMKNWKFSSTQLIASLGLAFAAAGCGQANVPLPIAASAVNCPVGQMSINGSQCASDFSTACYYAGGQLVSGNSLCQTVRGYDYAALTKFNLLSPSDPNGYAAWNTGIRVRPNDRLTISASGGWGSIKSDTWTILGVPVGGYTIETPSTCSVTSLSGVKDGQTLNYNGLIAGLVASDGTEVFAVGNGVTNRVITHDGTLKVGLNIPSGSCTTAVVSQVRVLHCENSAGQSLACP